MGFRLFSLFPVVLLQLFVYWCFIKYLKTTKIYKPNQRYYALIPFILFNIPYIVVNFTYGRSFDPPEWIKTYYLYPFYAWMSATTLIALILLFGKIIKLPFVIPLFLLKLIKPVKMQIEKLKKKKAVQVVDISRRKFVRATTFALSSYAFIGASYGVLKHDAFKIEYKDIKIPNLPPELRGTTITLISDIHAGIYMNEREMREYADIMNNLGSDIICIPGDFVNYNPDDARSIASAFKDLKAKHGIYGTLGNHDYFVNAEEVANIISNESPVKMMRNKFETLNINGKILIVMGVDDTRDSGARTNEKVIGYLDNTINDAKKAHQDYDVIPKVLLCHKPYGFDDIAARNIELTLSGHTHGGQVVPIKMGDFNLSFAGMLSKYIEGLYTRDKSSMYISRGIGTVALPIRINCPPEITKITLV
jgi:uncharacterized protein